MRLRFLLIFFMAVAGVTSAAVPKDGPGRAAVRRGILDKYDKIKNPHTRVLEAYNLLDLAELADIEASGERLYQAAVAARDTAAMLDALRHIANHGFKNDSITRLQLERAEALPPTADQRETVTYIRLCMSDQAARNPDEKARREAFRQTLEEFNRGTSVDIYDRIELIGSICSFLKTRPSSTLLGDYLEQMGRLVDQLPAGSGALRSKYYGNTAFHNTLAGHPRRALHADSIMLNIMDDLDRRHQKEGRRYISYDTYRYRSYRRMLANKAVLGSSDVNEYLAAIDTLVKADPDVREDYENRGLITAFAAAARSDNAAAVPLLSQALANKRNAQYENILLKLLIRSADASGNDAVALSAYRRYLPNLEAFTGEDDPERIIESHFLNDISSLRAYNDNLLATNTKLEQEAMQGRTLGMIIGVSVLVLVILALIIAYRRQVRSAERLRRVSDALKTERDSLQEVRDQLIKARDSAQVAERQKSDFINTISHEIEEPVNAIVGYSQLIVDAMDEKHRRIFERFANIIALNAQLVKTLVNDVLDAAELENSKVMLKVSKVSMEKLVNLAVEPLMGRLNPKVTLNVATLPGNDSTVSVNTDPARTEQVLTNLISNAVKFTEEGHINVFYGVDAESGKAKFVIEDTGPGIPEDKHETIFGRFEKLGHYNQGIGLGLYISRVVAQILGGNVYIDGKYTGGSRFVFEFLADFQPSETGMPSNTEKPE